MQNHGLKQETAEKHIYEKAEVFSIRDFKLEPRTERRRVHTKKQAKNKG